MRAAILLALITITPYASDAQVPHLEGEAFMMTMHIHGKEIWFAIQESDLDGSPAWFHPESDAPPFPIGEAIRVFRRVNSFDMWTTLSNGA